MDLIFLISSIVFCSSHLFIGGLTYTYDITECPNAYIIQIIICCFPILIYLWNDPWYKYIILLTIVEDGVLALWNMIQNVDCIVETFTVDVICSICKDTLSSSDCILSNGLPNSDLLVSKAFCAYSYDYTGFYILWCTFLAQVIFGIVALCTLVYVVKVSKNTTISDDSQKERDYLALSDKLLINESVKSLKTDTSDVVKKNDR